MQHRHVSDRDIAAQNERRAGVGVQHGPILNIAVLADLDPFVVAAHDSAKPDAGAGF